MTDVFKAQSLGVPIPDLLITAKEPLDPENTWSYGYSAERMQNDAEAIHEALLKSLPQGTIEHLLAEMLKRQARFTVRLEDQ